MKHINLYTKISTIAPTLALTLACVPDLDTDESILLTARVLAVTSDPAEPAPGEPVTWTALLASPDGTADADLLRWELCLVRPALAESSTFSSRCLQGDPDALRPLGSGAQVTGALPEDACARFGPDPPPPEPGQPAARPAEPDLTGGYRHPILLNDLALGAQTTLEQRLRCGLAGASPLDAARFRRDYLPNTHPTLDALELRDLRTNALLLDAIAQPDTPLNVSPGQHLILTARWAACPDAPARCTGAETYLRFNPTTRSFEDAREPLRLAWIASTPGFALERTGASAAEDTTTNLNTFTVPDAPPPRIHLWVILRDARGGTSWTTLSLATER